MLPIIIERGLRILLVSDELVIVVWRNGISYRDLGDDTLAETLCCVKKMYKLMDKMGLDLSQCDPKEWMDES